MIKAEKLEYKTITRTVDLDTKVIVKEKKLEIF